MVSVAMVPDRWLVLEGSATSAANPEWFVNQFCAEESRKPRSAARCRRGQQRVASLPRRRFSVIFHPFRSAPTFRRPPGLFRSCRAHEGTRCARSTRIAFSHLTHADKLLSSAC
jgi:hypothetical protein